MASDEALLTLPAMIASRHIALANLDRAAVAADRFRISEDPEALHDFRVGLRRLRATARGYRDQLGEVVPRKMRRALRDLAEASTLARDTEVQLEWLVNQHDSLRAHQRGGYRWLHRHWQTQLLAEYLKLRDGIVDEFIDLERKLRLRLSVAPEPDPADHPMHAVLAASLGEVLPIFTSALTALAESEDPQRIHPPRLIGKRLRYLIDPFSAELDDCAATARELGALQDLLGDIHDRQVLQPALMQAAEAAGAARYRLMLEIALHRDADPQALAQARRSGEAAGLIALARLAQDQEHSLMDELHRWIATGAPEALIERVRGVQEALTVVRAPTAA